MVGKLESNRGRLRDMVEQGDYDQDALQAVADERGRLVAELTVLRTQMRSDIRAQLEADQRETLDRTWQHGRRWRGRF